jgi:hypothetical protein
MPAVTLKDPDHVDFKLSNLRKFMTKVKQQSHNTKYAEDLLNSTEISKQILF